MVSTYWIWQRIAQYSVKYQSGQDVVDTFNGALDEVQKEIFSDLSPLYQTNEKVRLLLQPWVRSGDFVATNGSFNIPDNNEYKFSRIVAISTGAAGAYGFSVSPITEGELVMYNQIPQRKPDASKNRYYYKVSDPAIVNIYPADVSTPVIVHYLAYPKQAKIAFTYTEVEDEYVQNLNADNTVDLLWTPDAANIILYKMLEKYGITTRDQWVSEYAKYGVITAMGGGVSDGK
jgi:hypothetical protein